MTEIDTTVLEGLKTGRTPKKPVWQPLDLSTLKPGLYLACDQSFTAAGLVELYVWPDKVRVMHATQIGTEPGPVEGYESDYARADELQDKICRWMTDNRVMLPIEYVHDRLDGTRTSFFVPRGPVLYMHEAPPIGGGKFVHPEVSLLSGYAFRMAIHELTHHNNWRMAKAPMVRRQDHAKLICGNANATKAVHHAALKKLFPQIEGSELITNGATRDALSVALTAATREYP